MATKKQQKRREKWKRHEYDLVTLDEEGNEVTVEGKELRKDAPSRPKADSGSKSQPARARGGRAVREVKPPSWKRVGKRAALFAPAMFLLVLWTSKNATTSTALFTTVVMMAVFLPFSYVVDTFMYRSYLKKTGKAPAPRTPRR